METPPKPTAADAVPPADTASAAYRAPPSSATGTRIGASIVLLLSVALVGLSAYLKPDSRGFGTHQQLGFGACGWLVATRLPCPSCGMTTAFAHTVRGHLLQAAYAQPAGCLLAVCAVISIPVSLWTLAIGRPPRMPIPWLTPMQIFAVGLGVFLGGWAFKIAVGLLDGSLPMTSWR